MGRADPARRYVGAHSVRPPSLPPAGGKVAFAKQMTDEGAEGRTVHYLRDYPHQSA